MAQTFSSCVLGWDVGYGGGGGGGYKISLAALRDLCA